MPRIEAENPETTDMPPIAEEEDGLDQEDASAMSAAQESRDALSALDHNDLFDGFDPDDEEDIEEDDLNDPYQRELEPDPILDESSRRRRVFGREVESLGQASSPRIFAAAAKFPNCVSLRVWKRENGTPVLLGIIDSMGTMEDFIEHFYTAMPKPGERRCAYEIMPVDINGKEFDKAHTIFVSEHHEALTRIRRMKEYEDRRGDDDGPYNRRYGRGGFDGYDREDASVTMASEMSRMFDHMLSTQDRKSQHLERALEEERRRQQERESERARERVDLATNAAQGVQVLTERMMQDESSRSERAQKAQAEQGQMLLTTLTSIFSQQQTMMQASMDSARRADEYKLEQERQRANREREEAEMRRKQDRLELEDRRQREREEAERKMLAERQWMERRIAQTNKEMEIKLQREREEMERRALREANDREARERWLAEERNRRESIDRDNQKEREGDRQRRHDRMMRELEIRQAQDREHAERMMTLSKQEMANNTMGGIGELLPKATGLLASMGIEPGDVVQRIFSPQQEEKSGWSDAIPAVLGVAGEVAKAALVARAAGGGGGGGLPAGLPALPPGITPEMLPDLQRQMMGEEEYEEEEEHSHNQRHLVTPPPQEYVPPSAPPGEAISFRDTKLGRSAPPQQAHQPYPDPPDARRPAPPKSSLPLAAQRAARNALRGLVKQLSQSGPEEWINLIAKSITGEMSIYQYIKEKTVKAALVETGASGDLVQAIIEAMKQSGLVPPDVPYGE